MLKLVTGSARGPVAAWMVELEATRVGACESRADMAALQSMVEQIQRSDGVRCAAVVPRPAGLAVAVSLWAADATTAVEWAKGLVTSCARHAGLGDLAVTRMEVAAELRLRTASRRVGGPRR